MDARCLIGLKWGHDEDNLHTRTAWESPLLFLQAFRCKFLAVFDDGLHVRLRPFGQLGNERHERAAYFRQAVLGLDRNIAQQIWVRERLVDAQDIKIDTQVEDFIALYTPVAVDLRFVLAMLKINNDLERIGDYAYSIARFVKETTVQSLDAGLIEKLQLERMFAVVLEMMNELQNALMDENPAKASSVIDMDDELDRLKAASDSILMDYAKGHLDELPVAMGLGSIFRKLERTGDHLTNIAEEIVFYIDAKVLKHNPKKEPEAK